MGRVKSQLRHDYKPRGHLPNRPSTSRWAALAVGAVVLGGVLMLSLENAAGTRQLPEAAEAGTMRRLELALPPHPGDMAADEALESETREATALVATPPPAAAPDGEDESGAGEADAAADAPGERLTVTVKSGDSLDRLFRRNGLSVSDLALMLKLKEARNALAVIKPGDEIKVVRDGDRVLSLSRPLDEELTMRIVRADDAYAVEFIANPVERYPSYAHGKIKTSLFEAGAEAKLSDNLIMNLAGVFAWDVDFALEIREGDSFALVYEEIWQDGLQLRDGDVLAAEFVNQGRVYRAVRYRDPTGRIDYFTPEGMSVRKAFLRTPVDFARVSSNFNPNRLHPILKTRRPHKGVDYAAPKGTPIKAAGDGRIILRGRNGGYGNCVIIQHGGNVTTLYAHLSRFARKARRGSRVSQGQIIGYVGSTGLATASHLHYEYRLNGVHRNPRTVPLPEAEPVAAEYREDFLEASRPLLAQLDSIVPTRLAQAE